MTASSVPSPKFRKSRVEKLSEFQERPPGPALESGQAPPDRDVQGVVFNIQRYSLHDGAGIRTIVFLKGCPLRCDWCSNPESQDPRPELALNKDRCLGVEGCDYCAQACSHDALALLEKGAPVVDRARCARCMACAANCPAQALQPYGNLRTVGSVVDAVERDSPFFSRSGGGMTLSGGEPLLQSDFALALLREGKRRRLGCAIETCGQVSRPILAQACQHLREIFFDIKLMDPAKHQRHTGRDNALILGNLAHIAENFPELEICVRTPVIPSINDTEEDIGAILDFLAPYPRIRYELLAYHRLGTQKYQFLDRTPPIDPPALNGRRLDRLRALVARRRPAP